MAEGMVLLALPASDLGERVDDGQLRRVLRAIEGHGFEARTAYTSAEARAVLRTEAGLAAAVVAWDLPAEGGAAVLRQVGRRFTGLPVFLVMGEDAEDELATLPLWVAQTVVGYVWPLEDIPAFIAGRVVTAARRYREAVLPPFFRALRRFDEAWFAYARFHPLYAGRYGMAVGPDTLPGQDRPTVFSTQSTHKLLAALSQTAMVHVRSAPRAPVDHDRFNEAFMMHGTTSPLYPAIASLDVAAGMMDGPQSRWLIDEAITEAVRFRQAVIRTGRRIAEAGDRPPVVLRRVAA